MCEALMEIIADKIMEKEELAEQRGLEQGLERGQHIEREQNIKVFILDYLSVNFSKEKIIHKIQVNFQLKENQAEEYFAKYAHKVQ